ASLSAFTGKCSDGRASGGAAAGARNAACYSLIRFMPSTKETRLTGHLGRGALLAMLLHAQLIVPAVVLIFVYGARDERNRVEEVDVAFRDVTPEELPPNLPPMDDLTPLPPPITEKRDPQPKKRKDKDKP